MKEIPELKKIPELEFKKKEPNLKRGEIDLEKDLIYFLDKREVILSNTKEAVLARTKFPFMKKDIAEYVKKEGYGGEIYTIRSEYVKTILVPFFNRANCFFYNPNLVNFHFGLTTGDGMESLEIIKCKPIILARYEEIN